MRIWSSLLIAAPVAAGLLATPAAYADGRDHREWHGDWHHRDHDNRGAVAGAVRGLGSAAILGGVIASQQPQYYAPPPPVVYAPPPPYYGGYYSQSTNHPSRARCVERQGRLPSRYRMASRPA